METRDVPLEPPLEPLVALLPPGEPFTPAMAARVGVERRSLERMLRAGVVRRLLRGVYVDATVPATADLRARALGLVVGPDRVVVGRTAAWVHGVRLASWAATSGLETRPAGRRLAARDVLLAEGVRLTTPLRTALDLGRTLGPDQAIAVLDGFLHAGLVQHRDLLAEVGRATGLAGAPQLRRLVAMADGRADRPAASVLRLRWYDARLPTPVPRVAVGGGAWLELAVPVRRFAAVLGGRLAEAELLSLRARGWRLVVLAESRLLSADPHFVIHHLEREYHQHLLDQVG